MLKEESSSRALLACDDLLDQDKNFKEVGPWDRYQEEVNPYLHVTAQNTLPNLKSVDKSFSKKRKKESKQEQQKLLSEYQQQLQSYPLNFVSAHQNSLSEIDRQQLDSQLRVNSKERQNIRREIRSLEKQDEKQCLNEKGKEKRYDSEGDQLSFNQENKGVFPKIKANFSSQREIKSEQTKKSCTIEGRKNEQVKCEDFGCNTAESYQFININSASNNQFLENSVAFKLTQPIASMSQDYILREKLNFYEQMKYAESKRLDSFKQKILFRCLSHKKQKPLLSFVLNNSKPSLIPDRRKNSPPQKNQLRNSSQYDFEQSHQQQPYHSQSIQLKSQAQDNFQEIKAILSKKRVKTLHSNLLHQHLIVNNNHNSIDNSNNNDDHMNKQEGDDKDQIMDTQVQEESKIEEKEQIEIKKSEEKQANVGIKKQQKYLTQRNLLNIQIKSQMQRLLQQDNESSGSEFKDNVIMKDAVISPFQEDYDEEEAKENKFKLFDNQRKQQDEEKIKIPKRIHSLHTQRVSSPLIEDALVFFQRHHDNYKNNNNKINKNNNNKNNNNNNNNNINNNNHKDLKKKMEYPFVQRSLISETNKLLKQDDGSLQNNISHNISNIITNSNNNNIHNNNNSIINGYQSNLLRLPKQTQDRQMFTLPLMQLKGSTFNSCQNINSTNLLLGNLNKKEYLRSASIESVDKQLSEKSESRNKQSRSNQSPKTINKALKVKGINGNETSIINQKNSFQLSSSQQSQQQQLRSSTDGNNLDSSSKQSIDECLPSSSRLKEQKQPRSQESSNHSSRLNHKKQIGDSFRDCQVKSAESEKCIQNGKKEKQNYENEKKRVKQVHNQDDQIENKRHSLIQKGILKSLLFGNINIPPQGQPQQKPNDGEASVRQQMKLNSQQSQEQNQDQSLESQKQIANEIRELSKEKSKEQIFLPSKSSKLPSEREVQINSKDSSRRDQSSKNEDLKNPSFPSLASMVFSKRVSYLQQKNQINSLIENIINPSSIDSNQEKLPKVQKEQSAILKYNELEDQLIGSMMLSQISSRIQKSESKRLKKNKIVRASAQQQLE